MEFIFFSVENFALSLVLLLYDIENEHEATCAAPDATRKMTGIAAYGVYIIT